MALVPSNHIIPSSLVDKIILRIYYWNRDQHDMPMSSYITTHNRNLWNKHHVDLVSNYNSIFTRAKDLIKRSDKVYTRACERTSFYYDDTTFCHQRFPTLRVMCQRIGTIYPMIHYQQLIVVLNKLSTEASFVISKRTTLLEKIREEYMDEYVSARDDVNSMMTVFGDKLAEEMGKNKDLYLTPASNFGDLDTLSCTASVIRSSLEYKELIKKRGATTGEKYSWLAECGWAPKDNESEIIATYVKSRRKLRNYCKIFDDYLVQTIYNVRNIRLQTYVTSHVNFYIKDLADMVVTYTGDELISLTISGEQIVRITNLMTHILNGRIITQQQSMQLGLFMRNELCKDGRPKVDIAIDNNQIISVFKYTVEDLPSMIKIGLKWIKDCLNSEDEKIRLEIEYQNRENECCLMRQAEIETTNNIWREKNGEINKNLIHDCRSPYSRCSIDCIYKKNCVDGYYCRAHVKMVH